MILCLNCGCCGRPKRIDVNNEAVDVIGLTSLYCPNCNSEKGVIDVDDEIAWYIYKLNKAGLKTNYSCAGHPWEKYYRAYIYFKEDYPILKDYFDKYKPKYLELELGMYGVLEGNRYSVLNLTQRDIATESYYRDNFIPDGRKSYTIRVKDQYRFFSSDELVKNNGLTFIDDPDSLMIHHNFHSDMKNLVNRLCI